MAPAREDEQVAAWPDSSSRSTLDTMKPDDVSHTKPTLRAAWYAALAAWLLLCLGSWLALDHWHGRERLAAESQAHSLVHALASALRTMSGRMARSEVELEDVLREIADTPSVSGIGLLEADGGAIVAVGVPADAVPPGTATGTTYVDTDVLVWDTVDVGHCAHPGPGGRRGRRWQDDERLGTGPAETTRTARLVLRVPLTGVYTRWRRDALAVGVFDLVALAVALGLVRLWGLSRQSAEYSARLQVAAEEKRSLEELNLIAAGLAHEIKNPLGVVRGTAQRLADSDGGTPEQTSAADLIVQEMDRVTSRINELLSFAKPHPPELTDVSIATICEELGTLLQDELTDAGLRLHCHDRELLIRADREQFRQVLFNLLHNVIRFAPRTDEVCVEARQGSGGTICLEVRDHGPGVPTDVREQVFSPYFTTSTGGTGLGLAIVRRICRAHGWMIACRDGEAGGAVFEIADIAPARND